MPTENVAENQHQRDLAKQDAWNSKWGYIETHVNIVKNTLNPHLEMTDEERRELIKNSLEEIVNEIKWQEGE